MEQKLTKLQTKVFEFICDFAGEEGFPPSYQEIAKQFQFSSDGTVRTYLEHLEKKGYIQRLGKARGIKILKRSANVIPIVGQIAAGTLTQAIEDPIGVVTELPQLQAKEGRFALKVKGDSMIGACIEEGDIAIIQTGVTIQNGQIAAVMYDGDATLKRVFIESTCIRLQPENEKYEPIYLNRSAFESAVCGKMIALIRQT